MMVIQFKYQVAVMITVTVNNLQALIELVESYSITGLISGAEKTISYRFKVVEFHLTFS